MKTYKKVMRNINNNWEDIDVRDRTKSNYSFRSESSHDPITGTADYRAPRSKIGMTKPSGLIYEIHLSGPYSSPSAPQHQL